MNVTDEYTVPQAATCINVSEETERRNIRSKRLKVMRRGTQWFIPRDILVVFANSYDSKTGQTKELQTNSRRHQWISVFEGG